VELQAPRLKQSDVTIERVAILLASASPKGLLIVRDELAGWLVGMNAYNEAGRAFWIEAYGGRPYRVERQKHPHPIQIDRLAVAVTGGTQPEKLAELMNEADDGLLARFCWFWPDAVPFRLGRAAPGEAWAIEALDRLRLLDLMPSVDPSAPPSPRTIPLSPSTLPLLEEFGREMQERQHDAGGLMRSAYGNARGLVLRLSLVLEMLWWCGDNGTAAVPAVISDRAWLQAAGFVSDYLMPMAERVYGDAAARPIDRHAATLARWISKHRVAEVHVRKMVREVRLPGLTDAGAVHEAAEALIEAGWLVKDQQTGKAGRQRAGYRVNPAVWADLA